MLKAILFDSDGVLVDSERLFFAATRDTLAGEGVELSARQWSRLYLAEGRRTSEIAALLGVPAARLPEAIARRDALFRAALDRGVALRPGARTALQGLAGEFRLAVVTGAARGHFARVHAQSGLAGFFELVVTGEDCDLPKPHPGLYLEALSRLGLAPAECWAVEDSPRGARSARAAGLFCLVVPHPLTELALCPPGCAVLEDLARLPELARQGG